jgi:hypothetical protein
VGELEISDTGVSGCDRQLLHSFYELGGLTSTSF